MVSSGHRGFHRLSFELLFPNHIYALFSSSSFQTTNIISFISVAAAGLPEAREDHAIAMAKFARDSLHKFHRLVRQMEVVLG